MAASILITLNLQDFLNKIVTLSYSGDVRMGIAEDPWKAFLWQRYGKWASPFTLKCEVAYQYFMPAGNCTRYRTDP
eukprot:929843-Pelagomonas_calceolata.AAC.1